MPPVELPAIVQTLRRQMPYLSDRYAVQSLGVFGSYAREQQRSDSDLDLLVTFGKTPGLITYLELENYLTDLLGIQVDLVMASALKPTIGEQIQREVLTV